MLREKGAERPGTSRAGHEKRPASSPVPAANSPLFESGMKFESGTGWPSFKEPIPDSVDTVADDTYLGGHHAGYGRIRTEVSCARCGSHLGHVFNDGPQPSGLRYCTNGVGLKFSPPRRGRPRALNITI